MKPTILDVEQGSDEWLSIRKEKISATDVAAILGVSPWVTPLQLWKRKLGFESQQQQTQAMRYGSELEPHVRNLVEAKLGLSFPPCVALHGEASWRMASLDGYNDVTNTVLEIKCANAKDHEEAKKGNIPAKYISQLQWQMMVMGAKLAYYASYNNDDLVIVEVDFDNEYIASIMPKVAEFYKCVLEMQEPKHNEDNEDLRALCKELRILRGEQTVIKEKLKDCENRILSAVEGKEEKTDYLKVTRINETTTLDYKQLLDDLRLRNPELLNGLDMDKYKKKRNGYWKITPGDQDE